MFMLFLLWRRILFPNENRGTMQVEGEPLRKRYIVVRGQRKKGGTMKGKGVKEPCRKREMAGRGQRRGTMKGEGGEEPYRKGEMVVTGQRRKGGTIQREGV
jgi:hypothetical protein